MAIVAILKVFKPRLLLNGKWDWAQNLLGGIGVTWRFRIGSIPISKMAALVASLKILERRLLLNSKSY